MGEFNTSVEPVLGTRVVLRIDALDEAAARQVEHAALGEFARLERMLSAFRDDSVWSLWRAGSDDTTPELLQLLALVQWWHQRSGGAYNPCVGQLRRRWLRAVDEQRVPSADELAALAEPLQALPFEIEQGTVRRTGDCSALDVHGLAKGWIVDRVAARALQVAGVVSLVVNAGGDLLRCGSGELTVRIEDPRDPFDNSPPMVRAMLRTGGCATSSPARRPFLVGATAFHHVLDPRTGWPVSCQSATVIAPDAANADAAATVAAVVDSDTACRLMEAMPGFSCCVLSEDDVLQFSNGWPAA
jgi:thiamine biosynthesis lipoprotein